MTNSRFLAAAVCVVSILVLSIQSVQAQENDLSTKLSQFVGENGRKYIQPAVSSFSADLNSGIFQAAEVHGLFGFEVDLVTMFAPVPNDKKTFQRHLGQIQERKSSPSKELPQRSSNSPVELA
jgi:hypothetical protein